MLDANKTLWGSFLVDSPEGRIYFAGDSAYGPHFRHVYEKHGAPRVSLLPIGAYEPRWFMYRRQAHDVEVTNFVVPHCGQAFSIRTKELRSALSVNQKAVIAMAAKAPPNRDSAKVNGS